jgi:hypothetical protein
MFDLYYRWGREVRDPVTGRPYWANRYRQKLRNDGGVATARYLLRKKGVSDGLKRLAEGGRLDLSVERLVLEPSWNSIFTEEDRVLASDHLSQARQSI